MTAEPLQCGTQAECYWTCKTLASLNVLNTVLNTVLYSHAIFGNLTTSQLPQLALLVLKREFLLLDVKLRQYRLGDVVNKHLTNFDQMKEKSTFSKQQRLEST